MFFDLVRDRAYVPKDAPANVAGVYSDSGSTVLSNGRRVIVLNGEHVAPCEIRFREHVLKPVGIPGMPKLGKEYLVPTGTRFWVDRSEFRQAQMLTLPDA
jgi:hypothetical protein